jgi:serine/threonine protein kinase
MPFEEILRRKGVPEADVNEFADFLLLMFQLDPEKRAPLIEILAHPWLKI